MQSINLIISSIVQIILFSIIPFIWWLISGRKQSNFFTWLGIKKPIIKDKNKYIFISLSTILLLGVLLFIIIPLFVNKSNTAISQFSGQGISALIPGLIYGILQTGFSEELFFRGFLTKRLVQKFGFKIGNTLQALIFGLIHGIMFISIAGILGTIIIILVTGMAGWSFGWINEKQSNGSVVSSWLLHGLCNILASAASMFSFI